jgi:hypothetical protein
MRPARPNFLGETDKGVGVVAIKLNIKDGFREWQIVFGEIVVQTGSRRSKIRNARCDTDPGATENDNLVGLAVLDKLGELTDFFGS